MKTTTFTVLALLSVLYGAVVLWGMRLGPSFFTDKAQPVSAAQRELVARGENIFNHTPDYAADYTGGTLSCESCHAQGGRQPLASPMTGVVGRFPQMSKRAGRVITVQDRIRECFVRSENGRPPADDSDVMHALVAYLESMSPKDKPVPANSEAARAAGVGIPLLPELKPDPERGAELYATQCAGCHGDRGQGRNGRTWPPLWGPDSFNDGAGMNRVTTFAAFIHHNMPQNRKGVLSVQDAWDISAYVHQQQRPAMNPAYASY